MFPLKVRTNEKVEITPSIVDNTGGNLIETIIPNSELERLFYNIWDDVGSEGLKKWIEAENCVFLDKEMKEHKQVENLTGNGIPYSELNNLNNENSRSKIKIS